MQLVTNANTTTIVDNFPQYRRGIDDFTQSQMPAEWQTTLETIAPNITSLVQQQGNASQSWITTLESLLPFIAATYQQREILRIQAERARQGLPPIPANEFGLQVNVGLDPQTKKWLMIGGVALVAVLAVVALRKKRGSA